TVTRRNRLSARPSTRSRRGTWTGEVRSHGTVMAKDGPPGLNEPSGIRLLLAVRPRPHWHVLRRHLRVAHALLLDLADELCHNSIWAVAQHARDQLPLLSGERGRHGDGQVAIDGGAHGGS